jgi:hypothetical protein
MTNLSRKFLLGAGLLALSATAAAAVPAVVRDDLNLRSGPGTQYGVVGALPAGATVDVGSCTGRWCTVAYEGGQGYAARSYLDLGSAGGVYQDEGPDYAYVAPGYYGDDYGYYGDDNYYGGYGPSVGIGLGWGGGGWRHHRGHHHDHDGGPGRPGRPGGIAGRGPGPANAAPLPGRSANVQPGPSFSGRHGGFDRGHGGFAGRPGAFAQGTGGRPGGSATVGAGGPVGRSGPSLGGGAGMGGHAGPGMGGGHGGGGPGGGHGSGRH